MINIRERLPNVILVADSTLLNENNYQYDVTINIDVQSSNLSDFAWNASKTGDIFGQVDFNCLYNLEAIYTIQNKLETELNNTQQFISESIFEIDFAIKIKKKIKLILAYEEILLNLYTQIDTNIDESLKL